MKKWTQRSKICGIQQTVLREEFIVIQAFLKKHKKSQVNNVTLHIKETRKRKTKPKVSRRQEVIKTREEINEIEL